MIVPKIKHYLCILDNLKFSKENFPYYIEEEIIMHPRLIFRPRYKELTTKVDDGCHNTNHKENKVIVSGITINHYPMRNSSQYKSKIKHGYESFINRKLNIEIGSHWRPWYQAIKNETFDQKFTKQIKKNGLKVI